MLIGPPFGELRQIGEYLGRIGVEDMRPILVDEDPAIVDAVKGITGNMGATINDQNTLSCIVGKPLGHDRAGKSCAHDQIIIILWRFDGPVRRRHDGLC